MTVKLLKEAVASGKLDMSQAASLLIQPMLELRGMRAGEAAPLDLSTRLAFIMAAFGTGQYDNWMVLTDDSYWEPDIDYQALADCGVDAFVLRAYGPSSWVDGAFNPKPDPTYFAKFRAARATGKPVGAYVVHNEWEMVQNPSSSDLAQVQIKQWQEVFYDEFIPDFLVLDCEIAYCYRNGNQVTMPQPNLASTIRWTLDAMIKKWGKQVWLYSRVTWLDEAWGSSMRTIVDNFNAGGTKVHLHLAYYLNIILKQSGITSPNQLKALLPAYSGTMRNYLEYGNTDVKTRIWQLGPVQTQACKEGAPDWNIIPLTVAEFYTLIGFKGGTTQPPDTGGGTDLAKLAARVEVLEAKLQKVKEAL